MTRKDSPGFSFGPFALWPNSTSKCGSTKDFFMSPHYDLGFGIFAYFTFSRYNYIVWVQREARIKPQKWGAEEARRDNRMSTEKKAWLPLENKDVGEKKRAVWRVSYAFCIFFVCFMRATAVQVETRPAPLWFYLGNKLLSCFHFAVQCIFMSRESDCTLLKQEKNTESLCTSVFGV